MDNFPSPHVTKEQKHNFSQMVLRERVNKRKLGEIVREFTLVTILLFYESVIENASLSVLRWSHKLFFSIQLWFSSSEWRIFREMKKKSLFLISRRVVAWLTRRTPCRWVRWWPPGIESAWKPRTPPRTRTRQLCPRKKTESNKKSPYFFVKQLLF